MTTNSMSESQWSEFFVGHGLAYGFLSRVFYEVPDADLVQALVSDDLLADWPIDSRQENLQSGLNLMRDFCRGWNDDHLTAIKRDFQRLFIGPDRLPTPPWESVYRSPDRLMFEEQTLQVRQAYARMGFAAPTRYNEPEDHFGLELMFLVHLCGLGIAALEQNSAESLDYVLNNMRAFFTEHLNAWSPRFLGDVVQSAQTDYYRGAALLASGSLAETAAILGVSVETKS
ncbi:MAG: TorD/DmsD family molecular chaperone [Phototrophicaceae bacterium]